MKMSQVSVSRRLVLLLFVSLLLATTLQTTHAETSDQSLGDAYITHGAQGGTWVIGAGGAVVTLAIDPQRDFTLLSLMSASRQNWTVGTQADTIVTVKESSIPFGSRTDGFQYENVATSNDGHVLRLDATFMLRPANLRVTRHIAVAAGSPSFEVWTTFQSAGGGTCNISDLNALHFTIPAGTLHWLSGRQGDAGDDTRDSAFMRRQQDLSVGETLAIGAQARSSEQAVPWIAVDGPEDVFYASLMWSGSWSLTAEHQNAGLTLSWGLGSMTTAVGATPVDGPHAVFGVARGALPEASAGLRAYVTEGIRAGRPLMPLVTYNTWYTYGTTVDETTARFEIERAAQLGAEVFVVDAGWYLGADTNNMWNFDDGLGLWTADPARFPSGLRELADYARSLGLRFGLWIEPERVNLSQVADGGIDEEWLASAGGSYGSDHSALVCLAGEAGRQWVMDHLTALIDAVQPDYLKWDNNLWTNCDRPGHGHDSSDGSFAHVSALYRMLGALRERYPNLLIENSSGGGNRIDLGMLRYTDAAWMDDRTVPSAHVRHNIQGLSAVFPPAYLLSFVMDDASERLHGGPDLSLYFRSRMGGVLGLCFRGDMLSAADIEEFTREIAIYKDVRATLSVAAAALLTPQASLTASPEWDVFQASAPGNDSLVVYAYQDDIGSEKTNIKPMGLNLDASYEVTSVDVGLLGTASGADIMANGIDVIRSPGTAAHILKLNVTAR
jgi:alpha-galactosidase